MERKIFDATNEIITAKNKADDLRFLIGDLMSKANTPNAILCEAVESITDISLELLEIIDNSLDKASDLLNNKN